MVALFDIAAEMLAQCGLNRREAQRVLMPLVESTMKNLLHADPAQALTGSFARGDLATVKRHLAVLEGDELRDALAAYKLLGHRSLQLAKTSSASRALLKKIADALE